MSVLELMERRYDAIMSLMDIIPDLTLNEAIEVYNYLVKRVENNV